MFALDFPRHPIFGDFRVLLAHFRQTIRKYANNRQRWNVAINYGN